MIDELPPTLKEEVFYHQYGQLMQKFYFFQNQAENSFRWAVVRKLRKISYDRTADVIFTDQDLADGMYFIYSGTVKIYAENGFSFATFRKGENFGETDILTGMRRNGTARTVDILQMYTLTKADLEQSLQEFPDVRRKLLQEAIEKQRELAKARYQILSKNPIYGLKAKQREALRNISIMNSTLKKK